MVADDHRAISLFEKSIELCVASRALIDSSATLIESALEALESSRAMLVESDRHMRGMRQDEAAMGQYRVSFVDHGGRVFDAMVLDHDTDQAAIEEAHRRDVPSIGAGFDVWHESRLVHRHRR